MIGIAVDIARAAAGAARGIARFYGQPDGWPLKIEAVYGSGGWVILALDFQRRERNLLRAECPQKIRRRFGDCNKRQWIAFPQSYQLDTAAQSGYAYILWSDQRQRGWQQLTPAKLAELDLEA